MSTAPSLTGQREQKTSWNLLGTLLLIVAHGVCT